MGALEGKFYLIGKSEFEPSNFFYAPIAFILLKIKGPDILFDIKETKWIFGIPDDIFQVMNTTETITRDDIAYFLLKKLRSTNFPISNWLREYKTIVLKKEKFTVALTCEDVLKILFPEWYH